MGFQSQVRSRVSSAMVFLHRVLAVSTISVFAVRSSAELEMSFKSYSLPFHIAMSSSHFLFKCSVSPYMLPPFCLFKPKEQRKTGVVLDNLVGWSQSKVLCGGTKWIKWVGQAHWLQTASNWSHSCILLHMLTRTVILDKRNQ